jgi:hypothetical protein
MTKRINSGLLAPLFTPTLLVLLTPAWAVISGHSNEALLAATWRAVAWPMFAGVALITMCPLLILARSQSRRLYFGALPNWSGAVFFSIVSALTIDAFHWLPVPFLFSWLMAFLSSLLVFAALRHKGRSSAAL